MVGVSRSACHLDGIHFTLEAGLEHFERVSIRGSIDAPSRLSTVSLGAGRQHLELVLISHARIFPSLEFGMGIVPV